MEFDYLYLTNNSELSRSTKVVTEALQEIQAYDLFGTNNFEEISKVKAIVVFLFTDSTLQIDKVFDEDSIPIIVVLMDMKLHELASSHFYKLKNEPENRPEPNVTEPWTIPNTSTISFATPIYAEKNIYKLVGLLENPEVGHWQLGEKVMNVQRNLANKLLDVVSLDDKPNKILKEQNSQKTVKFDCYLSHVWGTSRDNYKTHETVKDIAKKLRESGIKVWLDEEQIKEDIPTEIMNGVQNSRKVICFVTIRYLQRANDPNTNLSKEFNTSLRKGTKNIILIVLEAEFLNPVKWFGHVAFHMGIPNSLYLDFTSDESIRKNFNSLLERIYSS